MAKSILVHGMYCMLEIQYACFLNGDSVHISRLDSADSAPGARDGDRPLKFNQRLGFNASVFQYAQDLPIPADSFPFPDEQVDATMTDAVVLLTVYPRPNPWAITDADIDVLAKQCARLNTLAKRRLLLRFGPEMNGNWNYWGQQPSRFRALWIRVFRAVRAAAPETGFVWAPSSGNGCKIFNICTVSIPHTYLHISDPYTQIRATGEDLRLLDTNNDRVINARGLSFTRVQYQSSHKLFR
jgi:hypothetical protein